MYHSKQIKFSIIIPIYNVEQYLRECLDSVLNQDMNDEIEAILINDGSTDGSGKICDEYNEKCMNFSVIHQDNQGLSGARNVGIRNAMGEYIIFLDSDDMLCSGALKNLNNVIDLQKRPQVIINRSVINDEANDNMVECAYYFDLEKLTGLNATDVYCELQRLRDCYLSAWLFCVKRNYIVNNELFFYDGIFHEDEEWVPRLIFNAKTIGYNNTCFYCYRINRKDSIISMLNIKKEFDKILIISLMQKEFEKEKYSDKVRLIIKQRIRSIYFGILCEMEQYKNDSRYSELIQQLNARKDFLRASSKASHRLGRILIVFFGIRNTGMLFRTYKYRIKKDKL